MHTHTDPNSHKQLHRWLLPYADLLTVLFVAVLAVKLSPGAVPVATSVQTASAAESKPVAMVSVATANTAQQHITQLYKLASQQVKAPTHAKLVHGQLRVTLPQGVLFAANQYTLTVQGKQQLKQLLPVLAKAPATIRIEGHTDNHPPQAPQTNWQLSALRAAAVADYLNHTLGLDARQLIPVGLADTQPVASNGHASGRQQNRRVTLVLAAIQR
jgi:chemotaxis protein MotB